MIALAAFFFLGLSPQAADPTLPPAGATIVTTVDARGRQVYTCTQQDGKLKWVFQAPEADLFDPESKKPVGTHSTGPTWTWSDGSAIQGKVLEKQPSPNAASIPWLLVETHSTGATSGLLTDVAYVRRSDTQAGAAPQEGCDAQHLDVTVRVPYAAKYTFYKKAQ